MNRNNIKVDEILANPLFRNAVHLVGSLILGYLLLRLLLLFLDAAHIGLTWLEAHQTGGLLIIFLILVFSILIIDVAISQGRRRYMADEKYSIAETGISYVKEIRKTPEEKSAEFIRQEFALTEKNISSLSEMIGTIEIPEIHKISKQEPAYIKKPQAAPEKPLPAQTGEETVTPAETPAVVQDRAISEKPEIKPRVSITPIPKAEKPARLEDILKTKLTEEPKTNIVLTDKVPILVKEGKRIIKSFESDHSINVIDFRSKVTKEDVDITIELLKRSSRMATPIKEKNKMVYEFDNIFIDISNDQIENASIRFKVKREWIDKNKILTIQFQQYINESWSIVSTKRIGQDTNYLFYEAHVSSFSCPFAIVGTSLGI